MRDERDQQVPRRERLAAEAESVLTKPRRRLAAGEAGGARDACCPLACTVWWVPHGRMGPGPGFDSHSASPSFVSPEGYSHAVQNPL